MLAADVGLWQSYAEVFAFLGNSLLKPMTQVSSVGIDPGFWMGFPDFGSDEVRAAADECAVFAEGLAEEGYDRAVERVAVEYTRLFIGPPRPAAPPWETMYRSSVSSVGFGEATFEMRHLLRDAGLQVCNQNKQYEDHMGIELLYISVCCSRVVESWEVVEEAALAERCGVCAFVQKHPASWIGSFAKRVETTYPGGYFSRLLILAGAVLTVFERLLEEGE